MTRPGVDRCCAGPGRANGPDPQRPGDPGQAGDRRRGRRTTRSADVHSGPGPAPVRDDDDLPLPLRPGHHRAGRAHRGAAHRVVPAPGRWLPAAHPVLRHPADHQHRGRRGDRAGAGVPVRHELVRLLALRRRRVRCAAGDRGAGRVLPRVDLPRSLAVRLGPALAPGAPGHDLDGRARRPAVGRLHHGGELVDAASGGIRAVQREGGADQHLGGVDEPGLPLGLHPRGARPRWSPARR